MTMRLLVAGAGVGAAVVAGVLLVLAGYRVDAQGSDPYGPELAVLWSALVGGVGIAAIAARLVRRD